MVVGGALFGRGLDAVRSATGTGGGGWGTAGESVTGRTGGFIASSAPAIGLFVPGGGAGSDVGAI